MPGNSGSLWGALAALGVVLLLILHFTGWGAPHPPPLPPPAGTATAIETADGPISGNELLNWLRQREDREEVMHGWLVQLQETLQAGPCKECGGTAPPPPGCKILGNC